MRYLKTRPMRALDLLAGPEMAFRTERLNINLSHARGLRFTVAAALLSDLATHSPGVGAGAGLIAASLDRVRILRHKEVEAFDMMQKLSAGSVYRVWLDENKIIEALPTDSDTDFHRRTLANMQSRGILAEGAGKWRAVF
jgi:hypothetical protein